MCFFTGVIHEFVTPRHEKKGNSKRSGHFVCDVWRRPDGRLLCSIRSSGAGPGAPLRPTDALALYRCGKKASSLAVRLYMGPEARSIYGIRFGPTVSTASRG